MNDDKAPVEEEETIDPFDPQQAPSFILITLMRIYDAQMASLTLQNGEAAEKLHELHAQGKFLGAYPWVMGSDEQD